ncbi:MAG: hypothetical protein H8K10_15680 [Nitrospira sp.]|nr:hypothetical protein [Nitrospira sp.]
MRHEMSYSDGRVWGVLTTERAESSRNIPVLVVADVAYGPADSVAGLPNADVFGATTAASLVANWGSGSRTNDERTAADRFCRQWIDGPQVSGAIYR